MLSYEKYRDNNNFLRINSGSHSDQRFNTFAGSEDYRFVDYTVGPNWEGKYLIDFRNTSTDSGKTWKDEQVYQLFGCFFFLSEDQIIHNKNMYTIVDLLSDFGGLYSTFVLTVFYFIGSQVNQHYIMGKFIRSLYYTPKQTTDIE